MLILDEKFKKDIKDGYISKSSMDDYENYFSNCLSNKKGDSGDLLRANFDTARIRKELGVSSAKKILTANSNQLSV